MREIKGTAQVAELIGTQRAVRRYSQQAVSEEDIRTILNAGRHAQSANNKQPWHFIVVRDHERLQQLSESGRFTDQVAGAAFAIALVTSHTNTEDDFDLGQAAAYLQLAAWDLAIGSCIGWIHFADKVNEILHLRTDLSCTVVLSFGYPASHEEPQTPGKSRRKPLEEVVRWEYWS